MPWRIVTTDFPPLDGGIATWAEGAAAALGAAGESVVVHARSVAGLRAQAATPTVPYEIIPIRGRSWAAWQAVWAAAAVMPRLRRGDVVVCATWPLAVHLVGPAARLGVPVLVAYHGSDVTRPAPIRGFELVQEGARAHLPVSAYLGGLLGTPFTVVPAPIDVAPPATPGDVLLTVARLTPLKGVDRVLRLGARLGRPVRVVGDGPERPALERLAAELGVAATFTGRLKRADIPWDGVWACALFSRVDEDGTGAEGLGLTLIEAGARGIPTLGTAVGGIPEVASVVLDDPERGEVPALPDRDEVRARVGARHGRAPFLDTLRRAAGRAD